MKPISIEDPSDDRLAPYAGLKDAALRRAIEGGGAPHAPGGGPSDQAPSRLSDRASSGPSDGPGTFIAEGSLVLGRLLKSPYRLQSVLVTAQRLPVVAGLLGEAEAPVFVVSQELMNAVTGFNIHRGVLAIASRRALPDPVDLIAGAGRIAVLEAINDHENLGVIFRNAAGFALDGVLLSPECCDPLYRRSVRVSMGYVLEVPYARLEPWPTALESVSAAGFLLVGLTPDREAKDLRDLGLGGHSRVAFLLGAEGPGLSPEALRAVDVRARIAMAPGVDSLNVGSAAAVAFHAVFGRG